MKKIIHIFMMMIIILSLSCAKDVHSSQFTIPDGTAGVSVDAEGNLVIEAPVYLFDDTLEKPEIKPLDKNLFLEVEVIYVHPETRKKIVSGTISEGRLFVTIPKIDENYLEPIDIWYNTELIKFGNSNKIIYIEIYCSLGYLRLFANPQIELTDIATYEYDYYIITGGIFDYIYSEGETVISGMYINPDNNWKEICDIKLTKGWNSFYYLGEDSDIYIMTQISRNPSSDAKWILR